nr:hypothetical protein Iba_chr08dCG14440 [Ipomoea batatas]
MALIKNKWMARYNINNGTKFYICQTQMLLLPIFIAAPTRYPTLFPLKLSRAQISHGKQLLHHAVSGKLRPKRRQPKTGNPKISGPLLLRSSDREELTLKNPNTKLQKERRRPRLRRNWRWRRRKWTKDQ